LVAQPVANATCARARRQVLLDQQTHLVQSLVEKTYRFRGVAHGSTMS